MEKNEASSSIVEFIPNSFPTATLNVYVKEVARPISKYLFGKFTEHLGRNIYRGMWAQILENPSFEPHCFFANNIEALKERLRHIENFFPSVNLFESFQNGVAYGWARYGEGDVTYSLVADCVGSWASQKIEVHSLTTHNVGIQQPIFLPLHREDKYKLTCLLYTSPSPRDLSTSRMPSSA